jgi:hypothetical protein
VAGATFLLYIAFGVASMVVFGRAAKAKGIAAQLARIAEHAVDVRVAVILTLLCAFSAVVLGVSLYAITRDQDADLAMMGLACRVVEGVAGGVSLPRLPALLWLATAAGPDAPKAEAVHSLGAFLLKGQGWGVSASFFAVGSTLFSYLLLRGRMVPAPMAWLGVVSSVGLAVLLPLQLAGFLQGGFPGGLAASVLWGAMLVFEVSLALWLIVKGAAMPQPLAASAGPVELAPARS